MSSDRHQLTSLVVVPCFPVQWDPLATRQPSLLKMGYNMNRPKCHISINGYINGHDCLMLIIPLSAQELYALPAVASMMKVKLIF